MQNFEYIAPTTVQNAVAALSSQWGVTELLMGGTDTMSLLKERLATPTRVVSLRHINELKGVSKAGSGLKVGSMTTLSALASNKDVAKAYPSLVTAVEGIHSMQHRAMSTVASDLLQRPRCWYFRNGFGLLGKGPGGKSLAPAGENQYHAILGNKGPAYFVNPSSLAPALVALGAKATVTGPEGSRQVAIADLYAIPMGDNDREVTIKPNEVITDIVLPAAKGLENATYEVRQRTLFDWPLATASVALKMKGKMVEDAVVVMGHVAPKPWRSSEAENALKGKTISESVAGEAGKAAVSMATPLSKNKHKVTLASVAVKRAVMRAAGMEVA
ncbi:MAG: molybdopterin dehydrogenase [Acidobacteria bacterium]|nr:molybdopterin dehydrogenase [Acidobacteriota bacterium]